MIALIRESASLLISIEIILEGNQMPTSCRMKNGKWLNDQSVALTSSIVQLILKERRLITKSIRKLQLQSGQP
ncbi:hypothetical protein L6164_030006 [Bauhinia variegata]|uniref:Uncharacterized protein n=1 Tax=Bauhinia variegata TaxID=167791 RepID=A0ACB9LB11_BAUVA|nr:hypothetical protein L6164_030006 [Bauhinia variegata]